MACQIDHGPASPVAWHALFPESCRQSADVIDRSRCARLQSSIRTDAEFHRRPVPLESIRTRCNDALVFAGLSQQHRSMLELKRGQIIFLRRLSIRLSPVKSPCDHQMENQPNVVFHDPYHAFADPEKSLNLDSCNRVHRWLKSPQ